MSLDIVASICAGAVFCSAPMSMIAARYFSFSRAKIVRHQTYRAPSLHLTRVSYNASPVLGVPHAVLHEPGVGGLVDRLLAGKEQRRVKAALRVVLVQD